MKIKDPLVSSTELSQLGVCERKVYLRSKYGARNVLPQVKQDQFRGNVVHQKAFETQHEKYNVDKRCFIASRVYGLDAQETICLRKFRDNVLLKHHLGRVFTTGYYAISPVFLKYFGQHKLFINVCRCILNVVVRCLKK
jgi:CRISPR/Cas system-associated exonuclease Cas4 (RecB family)